MFGIGTLKSGGLLGIALAALLAAAVTLALTPALAIGISQCVSLVGGNGNKKLINRCPVCRVVSIERMRPSNAAPVYREFTLPKNSRIPVSLYGPGGSRIVSDAPCTGTDKRKKRTVSKASTCVRFNRKGGNLVLVNSCQVCRSVLLERKAKDNSRKKQSFTVAARTIVPVAARGAVSAEILSEMSCPAGPKSAGALGPAAKAAAQLEALARRGPSFKDQAVETKRSWKMMKSRVKKKTENTAEALATAKRLKAAAKNRADDAARTVRELLNR